MENNKIGFLPLYIKLYDDIGSGAAARPRLEPFAQRLADELASRGFDVLLSDICRISPEFHEAVRMFEDEGCRAIVTWHAAYSPSLESVNALTHTSLPIVVLDTTETYDFSPAQDQSEISYCHGIHGVMDMCSMLRRHGKSFAIAAGHPDYSDVLDRTAGYLRAAIAATSLDGTRTGSIGGSFDGMGDFLVSDEDMLSRFGVTVVYPEKDEFSSLASALSAEEIADEIAKDKESYYEIEPVDPAVHERTVRNGLAVRRWIEKNSLSAFTANFREIAVDTGLEIMPFMEASKAMARGIGYAGEGDVLTASLVGALMTGYDEVSFVEIFCPDWKGNSLLLSHMGEYNAKLTAFKPGMKENNFIFGDALNPVVGYGCYKGGRAVFVNLYRTANDFKLFIAPVTMDEIRDGDDVSFTSRVRGWMRPDMPIADFLEKLSRCGATHHSALIYNADVNELAFFAELLGLGYDVL